MIETPHNLELERRSLSALMHGANEVQRAVAEGLTGDAYFSANHARIFKALCVCAADGGQTDAAAVWRILSGMHGEPMLIGEIFDIEGLEPTSLRRAPLTADVVNLWRQRRLIVALEQAKEEAVKNAPGWADIWERVQPHLTAAHQTSTGVVVRGTETMRAGALQIIENPAAGSFPGPFRCWDIDAKPLRAGQLVVLAGRPGTGKTAMALQYLSATLKSGREAAMFSLEMSGDELLHRMAHQAARSADPKQLIQSLAEIETKRLHIFEARDHASIAQIEARSRLLATSGNLGLVVIDYLGLVKPPKETQRDNRERQVAEMSRACKLLAGQLGCPLLLLHQLNRESEKDNRRPRLSDLRESGTIEQDADVVWLLWEKPQEGALISDSPRAEVHLIQAKRRNGQPNIFTRFNFDRPILTFTPIQYP